MGLIAPSGRRGPYSGAGRRLLSFRDLTVGGRDADPVSGILIGALVTMPLTAAGSPQRDGSSVVVKVLYIEDNDDDVYMLKMRLELLGNFEVLTGKDGEKGCEVVVAEQPDIILMDLEMPVMDGWEATRRLKGNPQTRDIPVIALSAHALAGEREKALAAGCNEFDTKPIEFDRLVATVRRILANRK